MGRGQEYKKTYHIIQPSVQKEIAHGICVSNLAFLVACELKLSGEECYELAVAGLVHDIGKLKLAGYIYGQEDTLTVEEMKYVRMHPKLSYEILQPYGYSKFIMDSILYHHENYDGSGYPFNIQGTEIQYGARILRICDVFGALTTDRPYRQAFDVETAVELMIEEVKNFDMEMFLAFMRVVHTEGIENILDKRELEIIFEEVDL